MRWITVEETGSAIHVRIDRPEKHNALSVEVVGELSAAVEEYDDHPLPLVISSATAGMFVAGTDVAALRQRTYAESMRRPTAGLFDRIYRRPSPTIAAVDGPALGGGCELALACDVRIASTRSVWGLPEVRLGLVPSAGGLTRLPELVGRGAASDLVLTGRRIDGEEAFRLGLVQRLTEPDELDAAVSAFLDDVAKTSIDAVRLAKEAMRVTGDAHRLVDATSQALMIGSDEAQARMERFLR